MTAPLHVLSIEAENYMGLVGRLEIPLSEAGEIASGPNASGKTSFLSTIQAVFGTSKQPHEPIAEIYEFYTRIHLREAR